MSLIKNVGSRVMKELSKMMAAKPSKRQGLSSLAHDAPEDINQRFECFFNRCDLDGWEIRQAINDLAGLDMVPDPSVIIAALHAIRRVNDYAMSVRFLEWVKCKCGSEVKTIYPFVVQEIAPTLCELGCDLPETLCYHIPELWLQDINDLQLKR